jgi:hypothetical protein
MRTKLGLMMVGLGELIADAGAWLARCKRLQSQLFHRPQV